MIGTNNSNGKDNTAEEIADGIIAICKKLRAKCPGMKILNIKEEYGAQPGENNSRLSPLARDMFSYGRVYSHA